MLAIFKNIRVFTILYLVLFLVDFSIKNNPDYHFPFRYISKSLLLLSLLLLYAINVREKNPKKRNLVFAALSCFLIGDIFLIGGDNIVQFVIGALFFSIAKIFYTLRFTNNKDFKIIKLLPFLLFCFIYMSVIISIVYNNLVAFFFPTLFYLFIVMLLAQFAYLRKAEVNNLSYWLVLVGVICSMFSDSINTLKMFYDYDIAYNNFTIMFFYGISQYLILVGILQEHNVFAFKNK